MIYLELLPIQVDLSDMRDQLLNDFRNNLTGKKHIRNYKNDGQRLSQMPNFLNLSDTFQPGYSRCNFSVHQMSENLQEEIKDRFSFLNLIDKAYVRFQMVSGKGYLLPHRDENRKTSIVTLLTKDCGESLFYEDSDNESIFPNPSTMKLVQSSTMDPLKNYIYNHWAFHSVRVEAGPRIAVSIGWDDIYADDFYHQIKI